MGWEVKGCWSKGVGGERSAFYDDVDSSAVTVTVTVTTKQVIT